MSFRSRPGRGDLELIGPLQVGDRVEQPRQPPRNLGDAVEIEASFTINYNSKGQCPPATDQLEIVQLELLGRQIRLDDLPDVLFRGHFQEFQIPIPDEPNSD